MRHPRTTQERRASQDGYARPSRNIRNLPSAYDDLQPGRSRSWKNTRRTQYRPVTI